MSDKTAEEKQQLLRGDSTDSSTTISDDATSVSTGSTSAPSSATAGLATKANKISSAVVGIKALLESRTWVKVGRVINLVYYPIDGGDGYSSNEVKCTLDGITDVCGQVETDIYKDRCLVAYNSRNEAELKPEVAIVDNKVFETKINALLRGNTNSQMRTDIPIKCDFGINDIDNTFNEMFKHNTNSKVKIGYFSQEDRSSSLIEKRRFNAQTVGKNDIESFLGNHSHYTLINNASVNKLKEEFKTYLTTKALEGNSNISYKCFRPHIVIDATPYCEDIVDYVRIGDVLFGNIIPCVHSNDINYNRDDKLKPFSHLYGFLEHVRPFPRKDFNLPETCSNMPKFGINMEMINTDIPEGEGIIKRDTDVWVTFKL